MDSERDNGTLKYNLYYRPQVSPTEGVPALGSKQRLGAGTCNSGPHIVSGLSQTGKSTATSLPRFSSGELSSRKHYNESLIRFNYEMCL